MTNIKDIYCIDINWINEKLHHLEVELKLHELIERRSRNKDWDEKVLE